MDSFKNNDPMEEFFQKHLGEYAEEPPQGALENIQQRLKARKAARTRWTERTGLLVLGLFLTTMIVELGVWGFRQSKRITALETELAEANHLQSGRQAIKKDLGETTAPVADQPAPSAPTSWPSGKVAPAIGNNRRFSSQHGNTKEGKNENGQGTGPRDGFFDKPVGGLYPNITLGQMGEPIRASELPSNAGEVGEPVGGLALPTVVKEPNEPETAPRLPTDLGRLVARPIKPFKKPSAHPYNPTKTAAMATPKLFAGELYITALPLNGGNGLDAGRRWQFGLLATILERPRWSLSFGVEYGIYEPETHLMKGVVWDEPAVQTDGEGNEFIRSVEVVSTSFGQSLLTTETRYLPKGDSLDHFTYDFLKISTTSRTQVEMLSMPMVARMNLGRGPLRWHLKGGFGISNIIRQRTEFEGSASASRRPGRYRVEVLQHEKRFDRLEKAFFQGYAGFGMEWQLNGKFSLLLEPTAVFSLSKLRQGSNGDARPWAIGLQTGVRQRF